ncbi:MAG: LysR family transcriptional regulator [Succinivibrio sp.]|nr:LysR family transcriptional regulator [Succinivibrio sp.]
MYDRRLRLFLGAAATGSFNAAARREHLTANALLKQIDHFEQHLGLKLFVRSNHGLTLTAAGRVLHEEGLRLLVQSEQAVARARQAGQLKSGTVRVGHSSLTPAQAVVRLWTEVAGDCPQVRLEIKNLDDRSHDNIVRVGVEHGVDLIAGLLPNKVLDGAVGIQLLRKLPLSIALSVTHPKALCANLGVADLFGERLLLVRRHDSVYIDALREHLQEHYPQIKIEDTRPYDQGIFEYCVQQGCLMVSCELWQDVHPSLITLPFDLGERFAVPYGLISELKPSEAVLSFLAALRRRGLCRDLELGEVKDAKE